MSTSWIYDIEQFQNFHSCLFKNSKTSEIKTFVIHQSRNDLVDYVNFLNSDRVTHLIGFNCLAYDYPLIHYILTKLDLNNHVQENLSLLFKKGQEIINDRWSSVAPWNVIIRQVDLFKIHHFDNQNRSTSLKDLQFAMKMKNIEDLPFKYDHWVQENEINDILEYERNDVESTEKFFNESENVIKLRIKNSKKYGIDLINASDSKMGEEIFIHHLSNHLNIDKRVLKKKQTRYNSGFELKDCILPYVDFDTENFQQLLNYYNSKRTFSDEAIDIDKRVVFKGFPYDFGSGGIHGANYSNIYDRRDDYIIKTCDVISYYPNLGIRNGFYPQHLGPEFCNVYEYVYDDRANYPKSTHFDENYAIKISLNAVYGKSNDQYSCLRDLMYMYKITLNGQLLLAMLGEQLQMAGIDMIMINTDGLECGMHPNDVPIYEEICEWWQDLTNLVLEFDEYERIVLRDVNNYSAITTGGDIKEKGAFEIDKDWHKNHSFLIVPIALQNYYYHDMSVDDTIENLGTSYLKDGKEEHTVLHDYCGVAKLRKPWIGITKSLQGSELYEETHQSTNRYIVAKNGSRFLKRNKQDGREIGIETKWTVDIMNRFPDENFFDKLDLRYYKKETRKIINAVSDNQIGLF